jgi:uncharacterized protein (DUF2147 family)
LTLISTHGLFFTTAFIPAQNWWYRGKRTIMRLATSLFFLLCTYCVYGQTDANTIVGKWMKTPKEDLVIEVVRSGDEFVGTVSWSRNSAGKKGFQILEGMSFDEEKSEWTGGTVRNPNTQASYKANAKILSDGRLEVLAYKGLKFIGKKKYFKRVE